MDFSTIIKQVNQMCEKYGYWKVMLTIALFIFIWRLPNLLSAIAQ